jgi:hypothetical protein
MRQVEYVFATLRIEVGDPVALKPLRFVRAELDVQGSMIYDHPRDCSRAGRLRSLAKTPYDIFRDDYEGEEWQHVVSI